VFGSLPGTVVAISPFGKRDRLECYELRPKKPSRSFLWRMGTPGHQFFFLTNHRRVRVGYVNVGYVRIETRTSLTATLGTRSRRGVRDSFRRKAAQLIGVFYAPPPPSKRWRFLVSYSSRVQILQRARTRRDCRRGFYEKSQTDQKAAVRCDGERPPAPTQSLPQPSPFPGVCEFSAVYFFCLSVFVLSLLYRDFVLCSFRVA